MRVYAGNRMWCGLPEYSTQEVPSDQGTEEQKYSKCLDAMDPTTCSVSRCAETPPCRRHRTAGSAEHLVGANGRQGRTCDRSGGSRWIQRVRPGRREAR